MKLYVKNMACLSCTVVVKEALEEMKIQPIKVELGEIETKEDLTDIEKQKLNDKIKKVGLELLESKQGAIIERIRKVAVEYVYHTEEKLITNFSDYLSQKLNYSYTYLSNLFSEIEVSTIEQYVIAMKIERIKELIMFDDMTLTEISYKLHYSSVAHLSAQFKKGTGLTPTHFKRLKKKRRIAIQNL